MEVTSINPDIEGIILEAYRISADVGEEVEAILSEGTSKPLDYDEIRRLLTRVIDVLRSSALSTGDDHTVKALDGRTDQLVDKVTEIRQGIGSAEGVDGDRAKEIALVEHNEISPSPIKPAPWFHGRAIQMNAGFIRTRDIGLWRGNERLSIHIGQFQHINGREPRSEELLEIMQSKMPLQGVVKEDQFEIVDLARSIAVNGVRKPPIIDVDGTLLDGNRRVTACNYVLASDEFNTAEKQRAEWIFVHQLTEYADIDDRTAVMNSLNFEPDFKQPWPEYVKARKVHEEWQVMVQLESRPPGSQRAAAMKRELSKKYALGPETSVVNRYLKMVDWSNDFEDYHINELHRDIYEVKHHADKYFQYFDELSKGAKPGMVRYALNSDESLKHTVFELLYDGKFKNWRQIRDLKYVADNPEARDHLIKAKGRTGSR